MSQTVYIVYLRGNPIEVFVNIHSATLCAKERTTPAGIATVMVANILGSYQLSFPFADPEVTQTDCTLCSHGDSCNDPDPGPRQDPTPDP